MFKMLWFFALALCSVSSGLDYNEDYFKNKCTVIYRSSKKSCEIPKYIFPTCLPWSTENCEFTKRKGARKVNECKHYDCAVRFFYLPQGQAMLKQRGNHSWGVGIAQRYVHASHPAGLGLSLSLSDIELLLKIF